MIIDRRFEFPDPRYAAAHGLVAIGGDYRAQRLLAAYARGIFPWPSVEMPLAWYSPDPRMVLSPDRLHVPRSLRKTIRRGVFEVRFDTDFPAVIRHCAAADRPDGFGTWLVPELVDGLLALHQMGYAHSVEAWRQGRLVGGLYGIAIGEVFCGESMFFLEPDASKVAFVGLVERLRRWRFLLIDCQVHTDHMARLGAREMPRARFLDVLRTGVARPTRRGPWPKALDEASSEP